MSWLWIVDNRKGEFTIDWRWYLIAALVAAAAIAVGREFLTPGIFIIVGIALAVVLIATDVLLRRRKAKPEVD